MAERLYGGLTLEQIGAMDWKKTLSINDGRFIDVIVDDLIARAREADGKEEGWRDIESAPESTDVLVYIPMAKRHPVRIGRYGLKGNGKRLWVYGGEFAFDVGVATLWRPIAAPPAKAHEAADDGAGGVRI